MPAIETRDAAVRIIMAGVVSAFLGATSVGETQFPGVSSSERPPAPKAYEVDCREVRTGISPLPPRPANACERQAHWSSEQIKANPNNEEKYRDTLLDIIRTCDPNNSSTWLTDEGWKRVEAPPVSRALRDRVPMSDNVFAAFQQACNISGTTESYRSAANTIRRANLRYQLINAPLGFTAALAPPPPPPPPPKPRLTTVRFALEPREARNVDLHKGNGPARKQFTAEADGTYSMAFEDAEAGSWVMRVWHYGYGGQIGFCVRAGRDSSVKLWLAKWGSITLDQMNTDFPKLDACRGIAWAPPPAPPPQPSPSPGLPLWTVDCLCKFGDRLAGYYVNSPFSSLNASTQRLINSVVRLRSNQVCSFIVACQGGSSEIGEYRTRIENLDLNTGNIYKLGVFGSIVP